MTDQFRPGSGQSPDPVERELRRTLAARAQDAPDADALTERLLVAGSGASAAGDATPIRRRGSSTWSTWGTPLVAAACVAAIVGIVLAIVRPGHSDGGPDAVGTPSLPVPASSSASQAPSAFVGAPTSSPSSTSSTSGGSTPLRNVRVTDLTFTSEDAGWALGSATCLNGSGRCTALLRTTDGTTWSGHPNTPFQVPNVDGCPAASCVTHIRFANDSTGYAYGPDALYLTTDGAQTWRKQPGGAVALETLNDDVIRVSVSAGTVTVATADVESTTWTTRSLPGVPARPAGYALARTASAAYLVSASVASDDSPSVLWASTNDGQSWTNRGRACPAGSDVVNSNAVAVAPDGSVALACSGSTGATAVVVGTRAGLSLATTAALPGAAAPSVAAPFVAAASRTTLLSGTDALYRSTDGKAWSRSSAVDLSGGVTFAGFESATVGRLVTGDGQTIWTTRTAGRTWTKIGF